MPVNADKPQLWKADVARSVDFYNGWFMQFAPETYRATRVATISQVANVLQQTQYLSAITPSVLRQNPGAIVILRMATAPPIARDRLIGLAGVRPGFVGVMEELGRLPSRMSNSAIDAELLKVCGVIEQLLDRDIFPWLNVARAPSAAELDRAATIIADRLCGAQANPIIRNEQERRQLRTLSAWLAARSYSLLAPGTPASINTIAPGTFAFRLNVPVFLSSGQGQVNIPIDSVVMPHAAAAGTLPLLIEAKSAGDFANTNKRRKEEAIKFAQLRNTYGPSVRFILLLCGYFDSGYLGYEAAEGIDWVWEHRLDDLTQFGL